MGPQSTRQVLVWNVAFLSTTHNNQHSFSGIDFHSTNILVVYKLLCAKPVGSPTFFFGHGFRGYSKGQNVERALGFSLTGTVSTSPNLAKEGAHSATIITRPSGLRPNLVK